MNLLNLAPDIQEAILNLPRTEAGRDSISERQVQRRVAEPDWRGQRRLRDRGPLYSQIVISYAAKAP